MRYELKSVGLWPVVKTGFFFHVIIGFVGGFVWAMFLGPLMALMEGLEGGYSEPWASDLSLGFLFVLMPILGALGAGFFYTVLVVIVAMIYNLVARLVGGLEFDLLPVTEPQVLARPISASTGLTPPPPPPPPGHITMPPAPPSPVKSTPEEPPPPPFDRAADRDDPDNNSPQV